MDFSPEHQFFVPSWEQYGNIQEIVGYPSPLFQAMSLYYAYSGLSFQDWNEPKALG